MEKLILPPKKMQNYIWAMLPALIAGSINSYYWYTRGYRGGKLFFMGTIAFYGITLLILNLFK